MAERVPCHYVMGFNGERVLIPGCWSGALDGDKERCNCDQPTHGDLMAELSALRSEVEFLKTQGKDR